MFTKEEQTPDGEVYKQEFEVSSDEMVVSYGAGITVFDRKRVCVRVFKGRGVYTFEG